MGDGAPGRPGGAVRGRPGGPLCGVVLAAGAGSRAGGPKALAAGPGGPWLVEAVDLLLAAGCSRVVVVLGARAAEAAALLPDDERVVALVAERWAEGVGASLRAGLAGAAALPDGDDVVAAVVHLVDLPGTPVAVVERLLARGVDAGTLRQAAYDGRPGHPVVLGRDHWAGLADALAGDRGARPYLTAHGVEEVGCGDLHHGEDRDGPAGPRAGGPGPGGGPSVPAATPRPSPPGP